MALFRTQKKYDFRTDFMPSGGKFRHLERIIDPNVVQAREARMDDDGTSLVFLPYPNFDDPNRNSVLPDLMDDSDERSYGDWLLPAPGVRYMGKTPVTLLFDNPDDSGFIPSEHHPIHLIYETAMRAVKSKVEAHTPFGSSVSDGWKLLLDGDKGGQKETYGCLPKPGLLAIAYAVVVQCGKDQYLDIPLGAGESDKPVVFVMSQNNAQGLFAKLDAFARDGITGRLGVHFYDRKKGTCRAMTAGGPGFGSQLGGRRAAPLGGQAQVQLAGYETFVADNMFGRPLDQEAYTRLALNTLPPWERSLRTYTPEQCAEIIASQSGLPMSLLWAAWKSQPQFITDEMKTRAKNPVSQNFSPPPQRSEPAEAMGWTSPPTPEGGTFGRAARTSDPATTKAAPWGTSTDFGSGPPGNPAPTADPAGDEGDFGIDPVKQAEAEARFAAAVASRGTNAGAAVQRSNAARGVPPTGR